MNAITKEQARLIVKRRIDGMTDAEFGEASQDATNNLLTFLTSHLGSSSRETRVLGYDAIHKWREVDVSPIESRLPNTHFDKAPNAVDALIPPTLYDIILVPLFGFNTAGYRLGHGGGWYDRLLSKQTQAIKIGIGYECGHIEFAEESHDVQMNFIITDIRLIRYGAVSAG